MNNNNNNNNKTKQKTFQSIKKNRNFFLKGKRGREGRNTNERCL